MLLLEWEASGCNNESVCPKGYSLRMSSLLHPQPRLNSVDYDLPRVAVRMRTYEPESIEVNVFRGPTVLGRMSLESISHTLFDRLPSIFALAVPVSFREVELIPAFTSVLQVPTIDLQSHFISEYHLWLTHRYVWRHLHAQQICDFR